LLKIVLVNLNYRIGVYMNFAQSRILRWSVACNQNTVATRGGARHFHLGGHWRGQFCNKGSCQRSV